ncbi:hypothetical protein C8J57DRAFT_1541640 [Mycena rebaudengoi]|nr:hypothetical protein C8J57DRAFT_1541640 [Mycena rebaudengoi]
MSLAEEEVIFQHSNASSQSKFTRMSKTPESQKPFKDFSTASSGHLAGIAYIRPLDRAALENNGFVKYHYSEALTAGSAAAVSLAEVQTYDAPSFFTRGIENSTDRSRITTICYQP